MYSNAHNCGINVVNGKAKQGFESYLNNKYQRTQFMGSNTKDFHINMTDAFTCVYNWFRINLLSLNINKTFVSSLKPKTNL
jgi:hypothetical protein